MSAVTGRLPPASPCVGHCVMDKAAGLCTGCARTLHEIATWGGADDAARARVWQELPGRAARMGLRLRRLGWRGAALLDGVSERLGTGARLVAGPPGAQVVLAPGGGAPLRAERAGAALILRAGAAAVRLEAPHWLAVFEIAGAEGATWLALGVPQGRLAAPAPDAPTPLLAPDDGALLAQSAGDARIDTGLGGRAARVSLRGGAALAARLAALGAGHGSCDPGEAGGSGAAPPMVEVPEGAVLVVESPGLRAETAARPAPQGRPAPTLPRGWAAIATIDGG